MLFFFVHSDSIVPDVKMEDILIFIKGASAIPPLGLEPRPTFCFVAWECLPFASSCDNIVQFPQTLVQYAQLKEKIYCVAPMALDVFELLTLFIT